MRGAKCMQMGVQGVFLHKVRNGSTTTARWSWHAIRVDILYRHVAGAMWRKCEILLLAKCTLSPR